jgi:hypothetical protein
MNVVSFVLFLHVVGMLGLFIALGLDGVSVFRLRRAAAVDEMAPWVGLAASGSRAYRGSIALVVLSGAYLTRELLRGMMAGERVSELGWLTLSVIALVMFGIAGALSLRRMQPVWRPSSVPADARLQLTRVHDPLLQLLFIFRTVLALTIVFLMTTRPSLEASMLVMAGAGLLALVTGGLAWRRPPLAAAAS